ncbi:heme exporter protein CcmD [uncultured Hyphomonas sp.]|jgi:heme exporter protein D|uniref:heme exporter protein CcmD n=1 Tax=uncultured Hyphomonas sp. TaxID=225298 RepID=UPI001A405E30|nr:heme exporter protein CcmD [Hyphomonas sp.]|tara:strand:+ start:541 stop:705 length:165 start_codon:yes stop_codon:yes gene_type:complete
MLPDFDSNAAFIWASYSVGLLLIGGAMVSVMMKARAAKMQLIRIEARIRDQKRG